QHVPMRIFLRSCIAQGQAPLWCPYLLGGQPFFADPNTMSAYPLTYLFLPFPVPYGFTLFYFFHFLLAAGGMYFWARKLGLSRESGLLAGLLLAFSGFTWWEIIHPSLFAAFAWMPWWGAALEKASQKLEPAWAFAAGLVFALLFLAGSFQVTLGALYGGGLYLAYRLLTRRDWRRTPQKDSRLLKDPLFFLWGALPLLLLWIPAREFLYLSDRLHNPQDYETFQADLSLNPRDLLGLFFPVRPFNGPTPRPVGDYLANAGFLGPWAFFLFALGLRKGKGFIRFLAVAGLLAVLIAFGKYFPLHRLLCFLAPGFDLMRAPFRYLFLYVLCGTLCAVYGYESLMGKKEKREEGFWKKMRLGAVIYGLAFLGLGWGMGKIDWIQSLLFLLGTVGLVGALGTKRLEEAGRIGFLLSLAVYLVLAAWFYGSSRWGSASNFDYSQRSPALSKLGQRAGLGRVLVGDHIPYPVDGPGHPASLELPPDSVYAARIRNAIGYNPLSLAKTTDLYSLGLSTYARLMAVKAFAAGDNRWKLPGFSTVEEDGVIYGENNDKVQFVYSPSIVESITDGDTRLAAMRDSRFDPYGIAFLSETVPDSMKGKRGPGRLEYSLEKDDPNEEVFKVNLSRSGWTVFSEIMYPDWKACVDGNPTTLYTANHAFRAVWVPEGIHEVTFRYEPVWWKPLLWGLPIWVLSVMGLVLGPWRRNILKGL
ncbi:MAG TPA: hypothetical protein VJ873_09620, partial [bacterium]|nr:hypothetical protein [bacterium]